MKNQPSNFWHIFWYRSHSNSDRMCTRAGTTVQTTSSQQQHTVFTSKHCRLSPVDSLDVLRVTVLLYVQSDAHRRLWNREGQWQTKHRPWGSGILSWKKCFSTKNKSKISADKMEGKPSNYRSPWNWNGFRSPSVLHINYGRSRQ
jgi:hypothetical protein